MSRADRLRSLLEEVHARHGPLRPDGRRPGVTFGVVMVDPDGREQPLALGGGAPSGWDEGAASVATAAVQRDLLARGVPMNHAMEICGGKHLHVVTAGAVAGQAEDALTAHVDAWVQAAREHGWGEGPSVAEFALRREVERLEREGARLRGTLRRVSQLVDAARCFTRPGSEAAQLLETASKTGWEKARGE